MPYIMNEPKIVYPIVYTSLSHSLFGLLMFWLLHHNNVSIYVENRLGESILCSNPLDLD